jgi:predicted amidohydrolase YtcJ
MRYHSRGSHGKPTSRSSLALLNGVVHTLDGKQTIAPAVVVRDGKIAFVGSDAGARTRIDTDTRVVDLRGKMVLPGFVESHAHPSDATRMLYEVGLWQQCTKDGYLDAVKAFAAAHPDDAVIRGSGWDPAVLPGRGPCKEDLDRIEPRRPVVLMDLDSHAVWVNSAALALAGIDGTRPDPTGGCIERTDGTVGKTGTPHGEPSGTLRWPAMDLILDALPAYSVEQVRDGLGWYQREVAAPLGITTAFDAWIPPGGPQEEAYEQLAAEAALTMWVRAAYYMGPEVDVAAWLAEAVRCRGRHRTPLFKTPAVKLLADGVLPSRTAYMKEDYCDEPGFRGVPLWPPARMRDALVAADAAGFQLHVHGLGDAASAQALDCLELVERVNGRRDRRAAVVHLCYVDPADIPRLVRLGATAAMQPFWMYKSPLYFATELPCLGPARAALMYPMRSYFDRGARVACSSDWPVTIPPNPLHGIQTGIMRWFPGASQVDDPLNPQQGCTVAQMIRSYTINGARALFLDRVTGSIRPGKSADLIVLDTDITGCPPEEIGQAKVLLTVFRGNEVFDDHASDL